jgi:hypothetical protein
VFHFLNSTEPQFFLQGYNNIRADGARCIADAMRTNGSVKELYLVRWIFFPDVALMHYFQS